MIPTILLTNKPAPASPPAFPSHVFAVDAGLSTSYNGSSQTFADEGGSSIYDMWLGTSNSSSDDPTFSGTSGGDSVSEYFTATASNKFFTQKSTPSFINTIHKHGAIFTMYAFVQNNTYGCIWGNLADSAANIGFAFRIAGASRRIQFNISNGTEYRSIAETDANFILANTPQLIAISYNETTGVGLVYRKSAAGDKLTHNFTLSYDDALTSGASYSNATHTLKLCNDGSYYMIPTWKLWRAGMFDVALTETQLDTLWTQYHARKLG